MDKFRIIVDTREQQPWVFCPTDSCLGATVNKLDTGDYSIEGHEKQITIERKASVSEVARNITEGRFWKEIERMKEFNFAYIICEFSLQDMLLFPEGSNIPPKLKKKVKISGGYILKKFVEIEVQHGIPVIYAGDKSSGFRIASSILKETYRCIKS